MLDISEAPRYRYELRLIPTDSSVLMYTPSHFREDRPEQLYAAMEAAPLAAIILQSEERGFEANHLPVLVDRQAGMLLGHVARANPMAGLTGRSAMAIFTGPNAYVSPGWYASKAETGRAVPTWNYLAVHAHGRFEIVDEPGFLRDLLDRLTATHEAGRPRPWSMADAPEDYIQAQLKAVLGFRLVIERLEGKAKMSQNRSTVDRAGVADGLCRWGHSDVGRHISTDGT